jgi:hypothetical protein
MTDFEKLIGALADSEVDFILVGGLGCHGSWIGSAHTGY